MNKILRSTALFFFRRILPRKAYPVIRGPLRGKRFILGTLAGDGNGATVYFNMVEPEQTSAFVKTLKRKDVFFDIGANVGYYTILGSRLVGNEGKVFAFEPAARNLSYLFRHTDLNNATNVTIIPAACSDKLSLGVFASGENFAEGHLTEGRSKAGALGHGTPIPTIRVDDVAERLAISPNVMKIDVEGAEYLVLSGAEKILRGAKPAIFLSTHSDALRLQCMEYLTSLGYAFEVLSPDKENPSEFLATYRGIRPRSHHEKHKSN